MTSVLTWWVWMLWLSTAITMLSAPVAQSTTRILAKPRPGVRRAEIERLYAETGCRLYREYPAIDGLQVIEIPAPLNVDTLLQRFRNSSLFEYAEPDIVVRGTYMPNDPLLRNGALWNLDLIDAPEAWDIDRDAGGLIVAVIDSGVRYTHQDLAANMWRNWGETPGNGRDDDGNGYIDDRFGINAIANNGNPTDAHGHGTHVAGIIGAVPDNGVGSAGVAFRVRIMALKFQDAQLHGVVSDAIQCIDYARAHGARIINASWADAVDYNSDALRDTIAAVRDAGIIFVTVASNEAKNNDDTPLYPGNFPLDNIVTVAATDSSDTLALWSNYGYRNVDLAAPGQTIYSTWAAGDASYHDLSGTSMAAPHVAGACALVWARFPWLNYREVIDRILRTTDPLPSLNGRVATGGRLNLRRALSELNAAPVVTGIPNRTVVAGTPIMLTVSASDPENQQLRFSLDAAPSGASISEWTGQFSWTPTQAQGGSHAITVRVTDNGSPQASATTTFAITVAEQFRIAGIRHGSSNEVVITWNSVAGAEYRVEFTEVPGSQWQNHSLITGNGNPVSAFDNTSRPQRYYRVVRVR